MQEFKVSALYRRKWLLELKNLHKGLKRCVEIRTLIDKLESTRNEMKKQRSFVGKDSEMEMVLNSDTSNSVEVMRRKKGIRKLCMGDRQATKCKSGPKRNWRLDWY